MFGFKLKVICEAFKKIHVGKYIKSVVRHPKYMYVVYESPSKAS